MFPGKNWRFVETLENEFSWYFNSSKNLLSQVLSAFYEGRTFTYIYELSNLGFPFIRFFLQLLSTVWWKMNHHKLKFYVASHVMLTDRCIIFINHEHICWTVCCTQIYLTYILQNFVLKKINLQIRSTEFLCRFLPQFCGQNIMKVKTNGKYWEKYFMSEHDKVLIEYSYIPNT